MGDKNREECCSNSSADEEDFVGELEGLFSGFGRDGEILDEDSDDEFVTLADHQSTDYSLDCRLFPGAVKHELRVLQDLQLRSREVEDDAVREQLSATECLSATGAVIWNSGVVLGRFLQWQCLHSDTFLQFLTGSNCIEVGSGTGLCGLLAAASGAHVALTDRAEMLPLLHKNLGQNSPGLIAERARVCEYNWGGSLDALRRLDDSAAAARCRKFGPPYDVILAADCVYDFKGIEALLAAFEDLSHKQQQSGGGGGGTTGPKPKSKAQQQRPTLILLAYDRAIGHVEVYKDFFRAAERRGLVMERVDPGALDPEYFLPTVWVYQCCFFSHSNASSSSSSSSSSLPLQDVQGSGCSVAVGGVDVPLGQLPFRWHVQTETAALKDASQADCETDFGASKVSVAAAKARVGAEVAAVAINNERGVNPSVPPIDDDLTREVEALRAENAALRAEVATLREGGNARSSDIESEEDRNPFGSDDDSCEDVAGGSVAPLTTASNEAIVLAAKEAASKARDAAEALERFALLHDNNSRSSIGVAVAGGDDDSNFQGPSTTVAAPSSRVTSNVREVAMVSSLVTARGQAQSIALRVTELQEHLILNALRPRSQMELIQNYLRKTNFDVHAALDLIRSEEHADRRAHQGSALEPHQSSDRDESNPFVARR